MDHVLYATSTASAVRFIYLIIYLQLLKDSAPALKHLIIVFNFIGGNKEKRELKNLRNVWHLARDFNVAPPKITSFVNQ
jgi:hypothetical protein